MTRQELEQKVIELLNNEFDIEITDKDEDLRELFDFDSIDAIDMLVQVEKQIIHSKITPEEERKAMKVLLIKSSLNQICDYIEELIAARKK